MATPLASAPPASAVERAAQPAAAATPPAPAAQASDSAPPAPAAPPARDASEGWRRILESLTPKTRAYFREASVQLEGDCLVLSFPYSFHHKQATDSAGQVEPLLRSWLGPSARLELRLEDGAPRPAPDAPVRALAPEEDPLIKAAERKLEAKVVRVQPLKEAP